MAVKTVKKMVSVKTTAAKKTTVKATASADKGTVWSGKISRLRIYDQPASTGKKVFAYKSPGNNSNYIGYSDDPNMVNALFLARNGGKPVSGYTNDKNKIEWMDY